MISREIKLRSIIEDYRYRLYHRGVTDCYSFVCDCLQAVTGTDYKTRFPVSKEDRLDAETFIRKHGGLAFLIEQVLDQQKNQFDEKVAFVFQLSDGDVCTFYDSRGIEHMGIYCRGQIVHPDPSGIIYFPANEIVYYWKV